MFYPRALPEHVTINGVHIEMFESGTGPDLLYLHAGEGADPDAAFLPLLARHFRVLMPSHPGFGLSDTAEHLGSIDDLAYFYLDLIEQYDLKELTLVGSSIGAWLAMEIATKNRTRLARLVLDNPVGLRFGERTERDFFDIFHVSPTEWTKFFLADAPEDKREWSSEPDDVSLRAARNREAFTRVAWSPYLHNPRLGPRLHRADLPALVLWGDKDRIASEAYAQAVADALPQGEFLKIADAGHFASVDRPEVFAGAVLDFARRPITVAA
jgi:pimeloyl-ACP methyl ester carboxylesterase